MNDLDDDLIISKIEEILSRETIYFPSNIQITISEEDSKIIITLLDKYLTLRQDSISKQRIRDLIKKYEWATYNYDCDISDYKQSQAIGKWNVLQEILQESEDKNEL